MARGGDQEALLATQKKKSGRRSPCARSFMSCVTTAFSAVKDSKWQLLTVGVATAATLAAVYLTGETTLPNPCEGIKGAELFLDTVVGNVTAIAGGGVPVNVSSVGLVGCVDGSPLAADAPVDLAVVGACTKEGYSLYAQPDHVTSLGDAAATLLQHTAVLATDTVLSVAQCAFGLSGTMAGRDVVAKGPLFGVNPP